MFTINGSVTPNSDGTWTWSLNTSVPNGMTVTKGDIVDKLLVPAIAQLTLDRNGRIPTVAEEHAMKEAEQAPAPNPSPVVEA